nr:unnamed protein product [Digitaria exilis]
MGWPVGLRWWLAAVAAAAWVVAVVGAEGEVAVGAAPARHAYAAMMYMGTPRDYEFYVATRVMMRSLRRLSTTADRVVIASLDVPPRWVQELKDDGVKVVSVENLKNPYEKQENFNMRFKLTLNKLYSSEIPVVLIQTLLYIGVIAVTRLARPSLSKMCYNRRLEKSTMFLLSLLRVVAAWSMLAAYIIPFFIIPRTVHPLLGWPLYLLGSFSLSSIVINIFLLHPLSVLMTWFGIIGALFVMSFPWYLNGVVRALAVFAYAFCCAPLIWASLVKTMSSLQVLVERDAFRLGEPNQNAEFTKLY